MQRWNLDLWAEQIWSSTTAPNEPNTLQDVISSLSANLSTFGPVATGSCTMLNLHHYLQK